MFFSLCVQLHYVQSHQGKVRSMNSFEPDSKIIDDTLEEGVQAGHASMKTWVEPDRATPVWECRGLVGERFWAQSRRRREKLGTTVQFCQINLKSKSHGEEVRVRFVGFGGSAPVGVHPKSRNGHFDKKNCSPGSSPTHAGSTLCWAAGLLALIFLEGKAMPLIQCPPRGVALRLISTTYQAQNLLHRKTPEPGQHEHLNNLNNT